MQNWKFETLSHDFFLLKFTRQTLYELDQIHFNLYDVLDNDKPFWDLVYWNDSIIMCVSEFSILIEHCVTQYCIN